jgi:uncharacterized membrane protein YkoI
MRFFILVLATTTALIFSRQALAEDGVIIINPDGSVTESKASAKKPQVALKPKIEAVVKPAKPIAVKKETTEEKDMIADKPQQVPEFIAEKPAKPITRKHAPAAKQDHKTVKKKKPKPKKVAEETTPEPELPAEPISKDDAKRIAIRIAPPFSHANVVPDQIKGRDVFRVMLQTEDGERDILVDQATGDIVKE